MTKAHQNKILKKGNAIIANSTHVITKKQQPKTSIQKKYINDCLNDFAKANSINLATEYRFCPSRKWRFDWCLPDIRVAIEYEGIVSSKSRHTTLKGYTGDANKYNEAALLGWKVIRLTALNYRSICAIIERIKKML